MSSDALAAWTGKATERMLLLIGAATSALAALSNGQEALLEAAASLAKAAKDVQVWTTSHPSPHVELGQSFTRLLNQHVFAASALTLDDESMGHGYVGTLERRMNLLLADGTKFVSALEQQLTPEA